MRLRTFRAALERDPTSQSARFGLLAMRRRAVEANDPEVLELAEPLEGAASAVISGWRLAAAGEWPALRELEPELASAEGLDPAYQDAQRLRVRWRTASDDPVLHAEAVEIARELLRISALRRGSDRRRKGLRRCKSRRRRAPTIGLFQQVGAANPGW